MASGIRGMAAYESKAALAEKSLIELRSQLSALKKLFAAKQDGIVKAGISKYSKENAELKEHIVGLKSTLSYLQTQNGVKVVSLPKKTKTEHPPSVSTDSNLPPADVPVASDVKAKPKQQKKAKAQLTESAAKGGSGDGLPVHVGRLDLRIGKIVDVKHHPDADSLYVEQVDVGEEKPRTILSGLVKHVPIENMKGIKAVFICNLKPAKMRGILSEGMIMCASTPEKVEVIRVPDDAEIGTRVTCPGFEAEPDKQLNPKRKIWEQVQPDLRISPNGHATYKGVDWAVSSLGHCWAPTMKDCPIK